MSVPRWVGCVLVAGAVMAGCGNAERQETAAPVVMSERGDFGLESDAQVATIDPMTTQTTAAQPVAKPKPVASTKIPVAASNPKSLARQIGQAEAAIRNEKTVGAELSAAALVQQVAYRRLGQHPEWDAAVLAALPSSLHSTVRDNVRARREFRAMHKTLKAELPAWRIVKPAPAAELLRYYREAEAKFGVPWQYLAAINLVETGMGRIRGFSSAGAQGPMQFMPATWAAFGKGDINKPRDAIFAAARYLQHNGADRGNINGAIYNYNHSQRYVEGVKAYARIMARVPRAYFGFHAWQIFYLTSSGDIYLPVGYAASAPIPVAEWRARFD